MRKLKYLILATLIMSFQANARFAEGRPLCFESVEECRTAVKNLSDVFHFSKRIDFSGSCSMVNSYSCPVELNSVIEVNRHFGKEEFAIAYRVDYEITSETTWNVRYNTLNREEIKSDCNRDLEMLRRLSNGRVNISNLKCEYEELWIGYRFSINPPNYTLSGKVSIRN